MVICTGASLARQPANRSSYSRAAQLGWGWFLMLAPVEDEGDIHTLWWSQESTLEPAAAPGHFSRSWAVTVGSPHCAPV